MIPRFHHGRTNMPVVGTQRVESGTGERCRCGALAVTRNGDCEQHAGSAQADRDEAIRRDHDATHEAEMCGDDCIRLGLAAFEPEVSVTPAILGDLLIPAEEAHLWLNLASPQAAEELARALHKHMADFAAEPESYATPAEVAANILAALRDQRGEAER